MSACLIVDSEYIELWQYAALNRAVQKGLSIVCVLLCENTTTPRQVLKHAAYYLLRATSGNHRWKRSRSWRSLLPSTVPVYRFDSWWEGAWQRIPNHVLDKLAAFDLDVVIKFGMNLLRDPDAVPATYGVFSFHHGDPSEYRGRPAGFYELLNEADHIGVMVQRISNRLDAGEVMAYGECQTFLHSYRRTLENLYGNSIYLLSKALRNAAAGSTPIKDAKGANYRLPSNWTVARFVVRLLRRKMARWTYGLFVEKRWRLATVSPVDFPKCRGSMPLEILKVMDIPEGYSFAADPIPFDESALLCEAMDSRTGKGKLLALRDGEALPLNVGPLGNGHLSYPFVVKDGDSVYLLPEMAQSGPQLLALLDDQFGVVGLEDVKGVEDFRLKDPTLLFRRGRWWLFASPGHSNDVLFLWMSASLTGPYVEHPDSPIVMNPAGARPAGPLVETAGGLFRLGQDNRGSYGDGIIVAVVAVLEPDEYEEAVVGGLRTPEPHGPHTYSVWGDRGVVDCYVEETSAFAWLRRLRAAL